MIINIAAICIQCDVPHRLVIVVNERLGVAHVAASARIPNAMMCNEGRRHSFLIL